MYRASAGRMRPNASRRSVRRLILASSSRPTSLSPRMSRRLPVVSVWVLAAEHRVAVGLPVAAALVQLAHVLEAAPLTGVAVGRPAHRHEPPAQQDHLLDLLLPPPQLSTTLGLRPLDRLPYKQRSGLSLRPLAYHRDATLVSHLLHDRHRR